GMSTTDVNAKEAELVAWAAEIGQAVSEHSARHDRDGTFVAEAYEVMKAQGYLALAVPEQLGGRGATIRQGAIAQREEGRHGTAPRVAVAQGDLARHCSSPALASVMLHHVVLFTAWRFRRDMPGAEATLKKVADDGIVLVSTGGGDFTAPRGVATKVDSG